MSLVDWEVLLGAGSWPGLLIESEPERDSPVPEHNEWSLNPVAPDWQLPSDGEVDQLWEIVKRNAGARGLSAEDAIYMRPYLRHAFNQASAIMGYPYDPGIWGEERAWMMPKMRAAWDGLAARVGQYMQSLDTGQTTLDDQGRDQDLVAGQIASAEAGGGIPSAPPVSEQLTAAKSAKGYFAAAVVAFVLWLALKKR